LWEGTYRLRIRARSERGTVWENDAFVFHVQPPWYRSTWAYVLYAVLGAGVVAIGGYGVLLYRETQRRRKQAVELRRQKMANERLREANDRLREANQLKENFLASTSHELRTPLSNMMGYADVIAEEAPSSLQPFAEAIQESGEDLLRTLDALLYLSGLRAGAYSLDPQELDFRTIVRECVSPFTAQADECGIALTTNLPDEPVTACIDPTASEQIVKNLVDNAVKFTREGSVRVGMRSEPDAVVVTVTDTGVGIAEEFRPHLFEDFKQESEGLTREYSGTGIGLAVTKRFADLIGAGIEVESEKGVGTRFTVRFPRSPATQAENREERAAKSDGPSSNA
jgi:signal transduction histidine kinase